MLRCETGLVMAFSGALLVASGLGVGSALFRDEAPPRQPPVRSAENDVRVGCQVDGLDMIIVRGTPTCRFVLDPNLPKT
jgi:hypothetical protein